MEQHHNFTKNIRTLIEMKNESMTEFALEIGIPKSTLQSVLHNEQTTLDTALSIAEGVGVPLSILTDGLLPTENAKPLVSFLRSLDWFANLPAEKQEVVLECIWPILEALQK